MPRDPYANTMPWEGLRPTSQTMHATFAANVNTRSSRYVGSLSGPGTLSGLVTHSDASLSTGVILGIYISPNRATDSTNDPSLSPPDGTPLIPNILPIRTIQGINPGASTAGGTGFGPLRIPHGQWTLTLFIASTFGATTVSVTMTYTPD